ncbi:MAG: Rpn family recombination-promoting nuclease/putative transposase [Lachnospiraceae bacterium]|nr:Rpn family recombination-promoting nuclease/putative transposase [Lachnospiraceae bacterium]
MDFELKQYSKAARETAKNLRIIDDTLFRLMAKNKKVCQEILRTLLDMPELIVIRSDVQYTITSLHREIIIDAFCILQDGSYCNIEMQKDDSNDDIGRVRFHASTMTANLTPKGTDFDNIPDVKIIYLTEYDALNNGQIITHVTRCMRLKDGRYVPVNDGEDIYFANTCVDDKTDKAELMKLLLRRDAFYNEKFPAISDSINYFKRTKGGFNKMCKAVEEYAQSVAQIATAEANKRVEEAKKESEKAKKKVNETIKNLLSAGKLSIEEIAYAVSEPVEKIKAMAEEMNGSNN